MAIVPSQLLQGHYLKKQFVSVELVLRPTRNNNFDKKFLLYILITRIMTFAFEYLGEFAIIFENNLG
jgi:hypothetical protein